MIIKLKSELRQRGFKSLKTISAFWSQLSATEIFDPGQYDWMEHENIFAVVHEMDGFLGYYKIKKIVTTINGKTEKQMVSGLNFVHKESGDKLYIPINNMNSLQFPIGKYYVMTVPVDRIVILRKRDLTLKMWFS